MAQLAERSLPTPEIPGSNPNIGNENFQTYRLGWIRLGWIRLGWIRLGWKSSGTGRLPLFYQLVVLPY